MKLKKRIGLVLAGLGLVLVGLSSFYWPFPKGRLSPAPVVSLRVLDRNGVLLREVLSDEGGRCRWLKLEDITPRLLQAVVAAEDRSFYRHSGVNPYAVLRAFFQNLRSQRVVSGASTITQQLIRNLYHHRRSLWSKAFEAWMAVRLEHSLSKDEILIQYLNRVPFGNQAFGIEAASRLYFGKPAGQLSLAEAAFMAGLPRSPSRLNPYRSFKEAKAEQERVLGRMRRQGFIDADELSRSLAELLVLVPPQESFRAPHFCDFVLSRIEPVERRELGAVRTSLDYALQSKVEILLADHIGRLRGRGVSNGAAVVLDNASGQVLAMVGSRDFFDIAHSGQVNGALSLRQPGSTMKPFTYALALEGGLTAATLIDDTLVQFPTEGGAYLPKNYDGKYHGPVRMRSALACSYNIPAVAVLNRLGTGRLFLKLKALGFESLDQESDFYGLGLTLGNGEVTLLELAGAYAALARGGRPVTDKTVLAILDNKGREHFPQEPAPRPPAFSATAAYIITHILADKDARVPSFGYHSPLSLPFPAAAKTGTSKDFKDNWTVGYTPRYTVGVWVGNFDGTPMASVSGITGCGPLFRDIMLLLEKDNEPAEFPKPPGLVTRAVCPQSGLAPNSRCPGAQDEIFIAGTEPNDTCPLPHDGRPAAGARAVRASLAGGPSSLRILFPQDGDVFKLDPVLRKRFQTFSLRVGVPARADIRSVTWWVNGRSIGQTSAPFIKRWSLQPGDYVIKATALSGGVVQESRPVKISVLL